MNIIEFVDGKKTYIATACLFIVGGLKAVGFIDQQTFEVAAMVISSFAIYGLRDAINKIK